MYGRSDVNVKVERGSTFTFTRGFSYIVSIPFTHVKPVNFHGNEIGLNPLMKIIVYMIKVGKI